MKPVICITGCNKLVDSRIPSCVVYNKYTNAVVEGSGGLPWILPPIGTDLDVDSLLNKVDGLLLTGSYSNIEPHHYGGAADSDSLSDPGRDATTLALIPKAIERGIPILGICRGFQEINVALGGDLHQRVHEQPLMLDHREDKNAETPEELFALAHPITISEGSIIEQLVGRGPQQVNSLHGQGIDRLSDRLIVEAVSPDGLVEAFRVKDAKAFSLAVQWHPEWKFREQTLNLAIWQAFGEACRDYARLSRHD